jgi:hypothetical protein
MSLYSELLDRVSRGAKYRIDLIQKTLKIDGKDIMLEGNLIDENDVGNGHPWDILETLYLSYKRSVPSAKYNGKSYFKADSVEDLDDDEIAFNEPRELAQFALECYVLFASVSGKLKWMFDPHWFYQSPVFPECVVLREWVVRKEC